jgi:CheY-like chemotaxis protein
MRHPFTAVVGRALPRPFSRTTKRYLDVLDHRLGVLEQVAQGGDPSVLVEPETSRTLARRFLRPREGEWDDGDENLVRGYLDRWLREGEDGGGASARALAAAATALARIDLRPGTLWFFLWEMESMLESVAAETEPLDPRRSLMAKRILVVDDDENILNLEKTILEQKGFEVTGAAGGAEALRLLADRVFDLVLLDVMMPEVDGFTVCRKIKEDPRLKDVPVIFLTARGGGEALAEGFESGAVMYINKPFTANKLLTIVNAMLEPGANLS